MPILTDNLYFCMRMSQPQIHQFSPSMTDTNSALQRQAMKLDEVPHVFSLDPKLLDTIHSAEIKAPAYRETDSFLHVQSLNTVEPLERHERLNEFTFFVTLLPAIIMLLVARNASVRLKNAFRAVFVTRQVSLFIRSYTLFDQLSTYLILFSSAWLISATIWLGILQLDISAQIDAITLFFSILGLVTIYYLYRYIITSLAGWLFQTVESTQMYLYRDYFAKTFLSIVLPALLFVVAFASPGIYFWFVAAGIITAVFVYSTIMAFSTGISERTYGLFYFILYFCTVETAPLIFGIKLISEQFLATSNS